MSKSNILIQLDVDDQPSVFDSVVAVDSEVTQLFRHGAVTPDQVRDLVHGAMFTRGPNDLKHTAIFIGGSDVQAAEALLTEVRACFFGPMRVSILFDANGSNTTAAAAVLTAAGHVDLAGATATVLGATGPVGQRAARLLAAAGAQVCVSSRKRERAEVVCRDLQQRYPAAQLTPVAAASPQEAADAVAGSQIVIAAGAAGIELLTADNWSSLPELCVAIDLNAVPPAGIASIQATDAGTLRDDVHCYGAIGVGGLKMRIHKAAVRALFAANDQVLDAEEVYEIGRQVLNR